MRRENTVSASGSSLFCHDLGQSFVGGRSVSAKAPNGMRSSAGTLGPFRSAERHHALPSTSCPHLRGAQTVKSAMTAKVGAAAWPSQPAIPSAAAWLRRPVSYRVAVITPSAHSCHGDATRRPLRCALWARGQATDTYPRGRPVHEHTSNRCDRRRRPGERRR